MSVYYRKRGRERECVRLQERESVSSSRAHSVPDGVADNESDSVAAEQTTAADHSSRAERNRTQPR